VIILGLLGTSVATSLIAARREVGEAIDHANEPMHEPEIPADLRSNDSSSE